MTDSVTADPQTSTASARARINTVYMSTVFVGGAIASAVAAWAEPQPQPR